MRIERQVNDDAVRLVLDGRLDAAWSEPVSVALEEAIRLGRPRVELDMGATTFISSVGIGVMLKAVGRLRAVGSSLVIVEASAPVRDMLRIAKLDGLLGLRAAPATTASLSSVSFGEGWNGTLSPTTTPASRGAAVFVEAGPLRVSANTIAVGHLALAADAATARGLFGDGLAAGGTAVVLPGEAPRPDCLASSEAGAVTCIARRAVMIDAAPAMHGHFEAAGDGTVTLGALAGALLRAVGGPVAFVVCGECAGAFGAWARTSPDGWPDEPARMTPDDMRRDMRYAGEPMHRGESMVAAGFACNAADAAKLDTAVRATMNELSGGTLLHAHVAVAGYRPMPRSARDVATVGQLLAEQPLRAVMHALRGADRAESAFLRGSVWVVPMGGTP
jgi:anti-sigma B factor antagonist